jgi:hypothetical protein
MKARHAAALKLVVWYLMVPPASDWTNWQQAVYEQKHHIQHGGGDFSIFGFLSAPLSKWKIQSEFDSQLACVLARQRLRSREGTSASQPPSTGLQYSADHAMCIASDDPRFSK